MEAEIASYQAQVLKISKEANTLSNTIASLDLSKKKLDADIAVSQAKIEKTNLELRELGFDINNKSENIVENRTIIADSLRKINVGEAESTLESLLSEKDFSAYWDEVDNLTRLHSGVQQHIVTLQNLKQGLVNNKTQTEKKKKELLSLQKQLNDQKTAVLSATKEKQTLLAQTKNTEASYKTLIALKTSRKEAFEKELFEFENALKIAIDPNSIPKTGKGVLRWPLDSVTITQYFGNTAFATLNPQIYNGKGHTGIDLRATIGTPVKAAMGGVVSGTGNTDAYPGCYSYGKWVFIKHPNGLSTLYGHLSVISVTEGQNVAAGEIVGYSGNTGYSTGPHLHFGVYATQGVRIQKFDTSINCKGATIPLADPKAYLNPLSYL